jgi:hypothetical protein
MHQRIDRMDRGDLVVLVFGVVAVLLLALTPVLLLAGARTGSEWTGTIGCVVLLMWFMAMNGNSRSRARR